jgi:hypothetical protein
VAIEDEIQTSRRSALRIGVTLLAAGFSGRVMAQGDQPTKLDPKLVMYQTTPKNGQACNKCQHFEPPNACKLVTGTISPAGWCQLFAAKPQ